jgi:hypothetical protein
VTIAGWDGCDHTGAVHEGDSLTSTVMVDAKEPLPGGGGLLWLRVDVGARGGVSARTRPVLRWRCAVITA